MNVSHLQCCAEAQIVVRKAVLLWWPLQMGLELSGSCAFCLFKESRERSPSSQASTICGRSRWCVGNRARWRQWSHSPIRGDKGKRQITSRSSSFLCQLEIRRPERRSIRAVPGRGRSGKSRRYTQRMIAISQLELTCSSYEPPLSGSVSSPGSMQSGHSTRKVWVPGLSSRVEPLR